MIGFIIVIVVVVVVIVIIAKVVASSSTPREHPSIDKIQSSVGVSLDGPNLNDSIVSGLLKQATAYSKEGKWSEAIKLLRESYSKIQNGQTIYTEATYLRLPLYLQKAGKQDEAWREFNKLLAKYADSIFLEKSSIYSKMRLFLQREKKFDQAIKFGILSYASKAIDLSHQKRTNEVCRTKECISEMLRPLLKKADRKEIETPLVDLIFPLMKNIQAIRIDELAVQINTLVKSR